MTGVTDGFDKVIEEVKLDKLIDDMSFEEKKNILVALKLQKVLEKVITEEGVKQVGSCDNHDYHCSDCEVWFILQRLKEESEK